jgi:ATP-citrate lyase beta-subunit
VIMDGQIKVLDAVAKVDSCESYRQKQHWWSYELVDENYHYEIEKQIADADIKSWASMKLSLINPDGAIWLILWGGGVSVATFDTLVEHWYHSQIANYGELSGNPTTADNYEYTSRLIQAMCASSAPKKYLMIVWGIANFTNILDQMTGICKALDESLDIIKSQDITLLIRRWGIQDVQGLALLQSYCEDKQLNYKLFWWELYLTDIISYITF